jgi:hypothetical protein
MPQNDNIWSGGYVSPTLTDGIFYSSANSCSTITGEIPTSFTSPKTQNCSFTSNANIETGIISKGSKSKQEFVHVNNDFNDYRSYVITFRILPNSRKIKTTEDLKHKVYCTECGKRARQEHKFCSACGNKL